MRPVITIKNDAPKIMLVCILILENFKIFPSLCLSFDSGKLSGKNYFTAISHHRPKGTLTR